MVFPVVMHGCESWTVKKAECQRIDAFELWCWRRLLRVPWTARRANQSILKEISPGCSLEGLMLMLKLQYFGDLMGRANSLERTLMLGKIEARRRRGNTWWDGGWHHWVNGHGLRWTPGVGDGQRVLACCSSWGRRVGHNWTTELNWTELTKVFILWKKFITKLFWIDRLRSSSRSLWCHGKNYLIQNTMQRHRNLMISCSLTWSEMVWNLFLTLNCYTILI